MKTTHFWKHGDAVGLWQGDELVGFAVEALDGEIGSVDDATCDVVGRYLVVDAGRWVSGKKVVLPAALVERVDTTRNIVFVNRTREDINNAPDYHPITFRTHAYRAELGRYYGPGGAGFRPSFSSRTASDGPTR